MMMRLMLATVVTALLSATAPAMAPVLAGEPPPEETQDQRAAHRNECLLVATQCGTSIISIQDKIEMLKDEIAKGRTVYTAEELNELKRKLDEVSRTLDFLLDKR